MKLISWNVNGLRAVVGKDFAKTFNTLDADIFCLQETKLQAGQIDLQFPGYQSYWNYAEKKGYSGTAVFTRHTPLNITYGMGIEEHDKEGRLITLEMEDFYLVCCYTPNSQSSDEKGQLPKRLPYRMAWEDALRQYLINLDSTKPVIYCGDLNVAHEEIDLKNPKTNRTRGDRPQESQDQPSERRLHRCRAREDDPIAGQRLHRHIPPFLSRRKGPVLVVELPHGCPRQEHRLAYRLLHRQ